MSDPTTTNEGVPPTDSVSPIAIFWRYQLPTEQTLLCCTVDTHALTLDESANSIPLSSIDACFTETIALGNISLPRVCVQYNNRQHTLHLFFADALAPQSRKWMAFEHNDFVAIVHAYQNNRQSSHMLDPYQRAYNRRNSAMPLDKDYDPRISPWVYYVRDHPSMPRSQQIVYAVLLCLLTLLAIGAMILLFSK